MLFPCAHASVNNGAGIIAGVGPIRPFGPIQTRLFEITQQGYRPPADSESPGLCKSLQRGAGESTKSCKKLAQSEAWPKGEGARTENNRGGTENRDQNRAITASSLSLLACHGRTLAQLPAPRRPPCRFDPSEIPCFFFMSRKTLFSQQKPGAVSARASCTALDDDPLYTNHVTAVYVRGVVAKLLAKLCDNVRPAGADRPRWPGCFRSTARAMLAPWTG